MVPRIANTGSRRVDRQTEWRLVIGCQEGDGEAFRELFDTYSGRAYRIAYRMTGSHEAAEDVLQESWKRAFQTIRSFEGRSRFETWFIRVVVNVATDRKRAQARRPSVQSLELGGSRVAEQPGPLERAEVGELESALNAEVQALPANERASLILVAFEGLSYAEAAKALDCAEGTLAWRVSEARRRLAERLAPYLD